MQNLRVILAVAAGGFALGWHMAPNRARTGDTTLVSKCAPVVLALPATEGGTNQKAVSLGSAAQARLALQEIEKKPACVQRDKERLELIQALAALDPLGAMDYAKQHLRGDRLALAMSAIAGEWAKHDPSGAWNWACSLGADESYHAHTVMEEISRDYPEMAIRLVTDFAQQQPGEAVAMSLTAMRGMTESGNFNGAMQLAGAIPLSSTEEKGILFNFMAGQWAIYAPEQTAQWVESLPDGSLRNQALIGLGASWAEVDPPSAANFAAQLPPGEQRQLALQQAISSWITTDSVGASTWVNQFIPNPDFDQAVASVATMRPLMEDHVDIALSWANSINDNSIKLAALSEILSFWSAHDNAAAVNYVQNLSSLTPEVRNQLLKQLQPVNN